MAMLRHVFNLYWLCKENRISFPENLAEARHYADR